MSLFLLNLTEPVLFIHIPKTGGSSIRNKDNDIGSGYRIYKPDPKWPNVPSFAFVRDPFYRIESCWRDFRFIRNQIVIGYEQFVEQYISELNSVSVDVVEDPSTIQHHIAPMIHPIHGLQHAKFIGDFEYLQRDYTKFCNGNDIPAVTLPLMRVSRHTTSRQIITRYIKCIIENVYHEDFEFLEKYYVN